MPSILIANGVNLDLLGRRPENMYGLGTLEDLEQYILTQLPLVEKAVGRTLSLTFFQSNSEPEFLNKLSEGWDGAILNPGAWTHTSLALADRLEALSLPFVEVHLSQVVKRERFRQRSFSAQYALGLIEGFGFHSYTLGLWALASHLTT